MSISHLKAILATIEQEDYPVHSRVHKLHQTDCYVKREDELGCILSGSKIRKYRSLIPHLKQKGVKKLALIGSQYSNHILGLSSLLIENQIAPELFLLKSHDQELVGNALFTHLLVPKAQIHYIERAMWPHVHDIASKTGLEVIPEGGATKECLPGLLTLPLDIIANEQSLGLQFAHILIDSGTGITAAALIACFGLLLKRVTVHVMLAAGTVAEFHERVIEAKNALGILVKQEVSLLPEYVLHAPPVAKSFGATSEGIFATIKEVGQKEGIFLDPIYSSKLYLLQKKLLEQKVLSSPVLLIHSGGVFSLAGFQNRLIGVPG